MINFNEREMEIIYVCTATTIEYYKAVIKTETDKARIKKLRQDIKEISEFKKKFEPLKLKLDKDTHLYLDTKGNIKTTKKPVL